MGICYVCQSSKDTRPYGAKGQDICFDCMMADPERELTAGMMFGKLLDAATSPDAPVILTEIGPAPWAKGRN